MPSAYPINIPRIHSGCNESLSIPARAAHKNLEPERSGEFILEFNAFIL